jgi:thiol-disulfide isomerase/thioredoxin
MSRCLLLVALLGCADAFRPVLAAGPRSASLLLQQRARSSPPVAVVVDISSTEEFEKALDEAGPALVVVDYSTSWCGPCKIIAPKFDEFSEQYKSVTFLKVCMALATQLVKQTLRPPPHAAVAHWLLRPFWIMRRSWATAARPLTS